MPLFLILLYERRLFRWRFGLANRSRRRRLQPDQQAFQAETSDLETPWRLASYMDDRLVERHADGFFRPVQAADVTWHLGTGAGADYARFAQEVGHSNGFETYLVTIISRISPPAGKGGGGSAPGNRGASPLAAQVVCVLRDEDQQAWYHVSNLGMFGLYRDTPEVVADVAEGWVLYLVRDLDLNILRVERRS